MTRPTIGFTSLALAALLVPGAALAGGSMTRADFERCNQQAMQVAGISDSQSPAASPSTSGSGGGTSGSTSPSSSAAGSGVSGSGTHSGAGAAGVTGGADQHKLDRAVQAYRDCLQK